MGLACRLDWYNECTPYVLRHTTLTSYWIVQVLFTTTSNLLGPNRFLLSEAQAHGRMPKSDTIHSIPDTSQVRS